MLGIFLFLHFLVRFVQYTEFRRIKGKNKTYLLSFQNMWRSLSQNLAKKSSQIWEITMTMVSLSYFWHTHLHTWLNIFMWGCAPVKEEWGGHCVQKNMGSLWENSADSGQWLCSVAGLESHVLIPRRVCEKLRLSWSQVVDNRKATRNFF